MQHSKMSDNAETPATATRSEAAGLFSPVRTFWSGDWLHEHYRITTVGAVLLVGALTVAIGAIHARLYGHDIFFLLDNGWRALHGQRVHVDYSSAWGPLTFLLVAAGLAVSGGSVAAVSYANAFVASAAGLWSAWLAAGRSRTLTAVAYPCFVALLVAAPFALGDPPVWTSHGMVYNRYGYALLAIIMLECFQPIGDDSQSRHRRLSEPILTGCAAALLLFLKITYFIVALPLMGTSLLFWKRRGPRALGYAAGFAGTAILFLAYLRFDVYAMVNDLLAAGAARSGSLALRHGFVDLLAGAACQVALLGVLAIGCARLSGSMETRAFSLWRACRYPLTAVVVVGADTLLLLTNAQVRSYPLTALFAIVLLFSIEPALRSSVRMSSGKAAPLLLLLAGFLSGPTILLQSVGLVAGFVEARANPNPPGVLRFESLRLRPLVLYDAASVDIDKYSNGREYVANVNDGMRLLVAQTGPRDKVATLDMFNPFAYALGREPIRGGIAAAAYRYTLDDRHHPSPDRFLGDAAVMMVPKYPASSPMFYDGYRKIYEPAIEREFRLQAESSRWRLYRRVTPRNVSSGPAAGYTGAD
jgi:hypothetical protein